MAAEFSFCFKFYNKFKENSMKNNIGIQANYKKKSVYMLEIIHSCLGERFR